MTLDIEKEFMDEIDCRFPYRDKTKCLKIIDRALSISSDAVYSVVYELAYIPARTKHEAPDKLLFELLDIIDARFEHPLKALIFGLTKILIKRQQLSVKEAIDKMQEVRKYRDEYIPLNMLYFSCNDVNEELEPVYDSIMNEWRQIS